MSHKINTTPQAPAIENPHNEAAQNESLIQEFSQLSPEFQAKYPAFWQLPAIEKQMLLDEIHQNLNQAYFAKMIGPKLRHCSTLTKDFCMEWFESETNLKFKEEALLQYEARISIEEELTYIFESFSEELQKQHHGFYELFFDQKQQLLIKMLSEKKAAQKSATELAQSKENLALEIKVTESKRLIENTKLDQIKKS